ncbi:hypothetical protein SBC2_81360 (plasmid) [Caballeronia sp. SBC2]|nr:hypothetical protein SBC2_81360 [Caballeronia sp. SBC2]
MSYDEHDAAMDEMYGGGRSHAQGHSGIPRWSL